METGKLTELTLQLSGVMLEVVQCPGMAPGSAEPMSAGTAAVAEMDPVLRPEGCAIVILGETGGWETVAPQKCCLPATRIQR
jgi:hypothetical protein